MPYTYGSNDGNSTSDIENSKLVVMFGNNPAETRMSGGGITSYLEQARERSERANDRHRSALHRYRRRSGR